MAEDFNHVPELNNKTEDKPINSEYIIINKPNIKENQLTFNISCSKNIRKYFSSDHIDVQYDIDISEANDSIYYIPAVATVIGIAWAAGADILVEEIDETYLNSLDNVKKIFTRWFPHFSFSTRIQAKKITKNELNNDNYALLYSGGIDSLASYIRNRDRHPALISIWGAESSSVEYNTEKLFKSWKSSLLSSKIDDAEMYTIRTNTGHFVNIELLEKDYVSDHFKDGDWFELVSHGLIYTGLTAPITFVKNIGTLFMASSSTGDDNSPNGSHVFNFTEMKWASTKIIYDSSDLSRQEKIRTQLSGNPQYYNLIKVCHTYKINGYNCGVCEKCLRTITGLLLENIDPNKCNFRIHKGKLELIKASLANGWIYFSYDKIPLWQDIQNHIPNHKINTLYNAEAFFEWFKDFDFSDYKAQESNGRQLIKKLYYFSKYDPAFAVKAAIQRVMIRKQQAG